MAKIPVKAAILRQLIRDGVTVMFGNPGTTEESLLDALTDVPQINYVMSLQESVVVAMADGYARATRRPAVAQVHAVVGLGNAMAMLYQAHRSFTPLVVIAAETYGNLQGFDGFLAADMATIARPVTKWSVQINHAEQAARLLRRALKVAMTPPQGPVFLAYPMDVLDALIDEDEVVPTTFVDSTAGPDPAAVERMAEGLLAGSAPLMLIGDGVALAGANAEAKAVSELLGCGVYGVDFADLSTSFTDPLFQGLIGHSFGSNTRQITLQADTVLAVGTPVFPELFPSLEPYFQPGATLYQIDLNSWEIAKNYPVTAGLWADPKRALAALLQALEAKATPAYRAAAAARAQGWQAQKEEAYRQQAESYAAVRDRLPMPPSRVMEIIVGAMPPETLVFDESITSTDALLHYLRPSQPGSYFLGRGGCIGIGWPSAVGLKIANPGRKVVGFSGDGSALYVVQALWTAANQKLDMVFIVLSNHAYRILKVNLLHYWAEAGEEPREFPHFDVNEPVVHFDRIAEGFGVRGHRAETPEELEAALKIAFTEPGPHLIDVRVDGSVKQEERNLVRAHCGCS